MKMKSENIKLTIFVFLILTIFGFKANSQTLPADILMKLNAYNIVWTTASTTGSAGSMPLGNGDITSNVWVENNGDLMLYIGKSDSWSEGTRLLKIGRIRISLVPNPFISGKTFNQELNLSKGEINIIAGDVGAEISLKIWIDANNPVIHVEANSSQKFAMTCKTEIMRPLSYTLPSATDPLAESFRGVLDGPVKPSESADIVASKEGMLEWYHRNDNSMFSTILTNENLGESVNSFTDPFLNRTFGAIVKADGFSKIDDSTLQTSKDTTIVSLSIYSYTSQTATIEDWENQFNAKIIETEATSLTSAYTNHCAWWDNFWNRSWIFITGDADAIRVTQSYLLQRFMTASMGRGKYPIKFNGGSLTFDYAGKNGDFRRWGPGYWNQNVRHIYWPMLSAGDYEMMMPWFDCYMNMIDIQKAHTQKLYNHDGAFFPETFNFFGLNILDDWGWGNTDIKTINPYIRYHYSGALEVISQMLDYYYFTKDDSIIEKYIVPFSTEVIRFYDKHYPRENGKIKFYPANALETFWDCTNPTDIIAGLRYSIPRLCALQDNAVTQTLKDEWNNCLIALPAIPIDTITSAVKPAEIFTGANNSEDPDCYSIFPYKIYGLGRDSIEIAIQTFGNRRVKASTCWAPDPIWAAMTGISDVAKLDVIANSKSVDVGVRFPAFWAPRNDYMPDFDNGGALMMGLQSMLLQSVDKQLLVLPAWNVTWNVDYKLQAYNNTTVRVISEGTTISQIDVFPEERAKDVVLSNSKQNQSLTFPVLPPCKMGKADFSHKAVSSSGLPVSILISDPTVASLIGTKIHLVGPGTAVIKAFQPGDDTYNASPAIERILIVSSATSVEKIESENPNEFVLFPNPAGNQITIKNLQPDSQITIFSFDGKIIFKEVAENSEDKTIDVSNLEKGIYIVNVNNAKTSVNEKFVIN